MKFMKTWFLGYEGCGWCGAAQVDLQAAQGVLVSVLFFIQGYILALLPGLPSIGEKNYQKNSSFVQMGMVNKLVFGLQ